MDIHQMFLTTIAILVMLVILTVIIFVHELGHYSAARFFGFQTPVFGLGLPFFGPYWTLFKKWGTEFRLHSLFVGGYVLIPELGDESSTVSDTYGVEDLKPFKKFPVWQRAIVAAAGVFNNFVFAYVLMVVLLMTLGSPIVEVVVMFLPEENPIAREAGVKSGDRIIAIDQTPMEGTDQVVHYLEERKNTQVVLHLMRPDKKEKGKDKDKEQASAGGADDAKAAQDKPAASETKSDETKSDQAKPEDNKADATAKSDEKSQASEADDAVVGPGATKGKNIDITVTTNANGKLGMGLADKLTTRFQKIDGSFFDIAGMAAVRTVNSTVGMCKSLTTMVEGIAHGLAQKIVPKKPTDKNKAPTVGVEDLHGLLFVLKVGADIAQQDWKMLPMFTILISLDLAIINLLPWPGLDGGHLAFMSVEAVRGKPLGEKMQGELVKWGIITLLVLMALIMVNDIRSLVKGEADFRVKSKQGAPEKQVNPDGSEKPPDTQAPATPDSTK